MEEFGDENLKRVFGKLQNTESAEYGAEWSELESKLPPVPGRRRWMTASALLLVIGFVAVKGLVSLRDGDQRTLPDTSLASSENKSKKPKQKEASSQDETKRTLLNPKNKPASTSIVLNSKVSIAEEVLVAHDNKRDANVEAEAFAPLSAELHANALEDIDTVAAVSTVAPPKEEQTERSLRFQLSAGYLFGVVTPDPNDRLLISNYQTKPGVAAKILVDYPLVSNKHFTIRGSAFFHTVHKPFQFDVLEYGFEKVNSYSIRKATTQHHLGLGLAWLPARGPWEIQAGLSSSLSIGNTALLSSRWLHVSVIRSMLPAGKKFEVLGSVEVLAPLTTQSSYFRYVPLQLSLGLRRRQ